MPQYYPISSDNFPRISVALSSMRALCGQTSQGTEYTSLLTVPQLTAVEQWLETQQPAELAVRVHRRDFLGHEYTECMLSPPGHDPEIDMAVLLMDISLEDDHAHA